MDSPLLDGMHSSKETLFHKATIEDLGTCVKLVSEFYSKTPYFGSIEVDQNEITKTLLYHILSDTSLLLVNDGGILVATLVPSVLNPKVVVAQEVVWYGKHGKEMLTAFEEWAEEQGASLIALSSIIDEREESLRRLYKKYGYSPVETTFIKGVV